jgi:hypothetical protein
MKDTMNLQTKAMKRGKQFGVDHLLNPANAVATAAFTALGTAIIQIEAIDTARLNGMSTSRGAVIERKFRRKALRSALSDLSRVSKTLDKIAHPDVAAQLKMGRLGKDADLLAFANNAIAVVTPIKQVFIDRGAAVTVVEDLQDLLDAFVATADRRFSGLGIQLGSNAALKEAIRAGMDQLRVLDGILSQVLKPMPALLAEWKAAKRVERRYKKEEEQQPAPAPAGDSGPGTNIINS